MSLNDSSQRGNRESLLNKLNICPLENEEDKNEEQQFAQDPQIEEDIITKLIFSSSPRKDGLAEDERAQANIDSAYKRLSAREGVTSNNEDMFAVHD
jgi:hypothetical protein